MSNTPRTVVVTDAFLDRASAIEQFLGRDKSRRGRVFVAALLDFVYDTVGPLPLAFPAYVLASHPQLPLRRAVFQRRYNVLYAVSATEVRFLTLFSTAQNPADIEL